LFKNDFSVFCWTIKDFLEAYSLSKICKIVLEHTLKGSQLISSSDNKKILLTTRNVRLDSGHYATKYYCYDFIRIWTNEQKTLWLELWREFPLHSVFLEYWNTTKSLCSIWQCLLDEVFAKLCKKFSFHGDCLRADQGKANDWYQMWAGSSKSNFLHILWYFHT
jgi:hypothetical protein